MFERWGEPLELRPVAGELVWICERMEARTGRVSREEGMMSDWRIEEVLAWDAIVL